MSIMLSSHHHHLLPELLEVHVWCTEPSEYASDSRASREHGGRHGSQSYCSPSPSLMGAPAASGWVQWAPGHGERDTLLSFSFASAKPRKNPGRGANEELALDFN